MGQDSCLSAGIMINKVVFQYAIPRRHYREDYIFSNKEFS